MVEQGPQVAETEINGPGHRLRGVAGEEQVLAARPSEGHQWQIYRSVNLPVVDGKSPAIFKVQWGWFIDMETYH